MSSVPALDENLDASRCSTCPHHDCCRKSSCDRALGSLLYGVEPLKAHVPGYCNYLSPTGCIIEWNRRPKQCRVFMCTEWVTEDAKKTGVSVEEAVRAHQEEILVAAREDSMKAQETLDKLSGRPSASLSRLIDPV